MWSSKGEYNLSVALKPWFTQLYAWVFYLPLAFIGVPWSLATSYAVNLLYQLWIHAETIGRWGIRMDFQ